MSATERAVRIIDPRAIRVGLAGASGRTGVDPITVEPSAVTPEPAPGIAGEGVLAGGPPSATAFQPAQSRADGLALIDGEPAKVSLDHLDAVHRVLIWPVEGRVTRTRVALLPVERGVSRSSGIVHREVVVDGWRVEVEIEAERRATLRERARRSGEAAARSGPTDVRAIIPGRIVTVSVVPGDRVVAGQPLLVVEAMKMQNDLRAPRDGIVSSVAVGVGGTVEVGDLMVVLG